MAEFTAEDEAGTPKSSIHSAPVRAVLDRLHAEAGQQTLRFVGLGVAMARDKLLGRANSLPSEIDRLIKPLRARGAHIAGPMSGCASAAGPLRR